MIRDGRTVPAGETLRTQVCVVGAGPAGLIVASELNRAGLEVVILERGPDVGAESPLTPNTGLNVGIPYRLANSHRFAVGGTTHRWLLETPLGGGYGRLRELDDADFRTRSWIPYSGWPFSKEHLIPFYLKARSILWPSQDGVSPEPAWDAEFQSGPFVAPASGVESRTFFFADPSRLVKHLRDELKRSSTAHLLTHSAVTEIHRDDSLQAVSSVTVKATRSQSYRVEATIFVLAAGGVENPRLLLASRDRQSEGLGNDHDLVGRFFMEHPHYPSGYLKPKDPGIFLDEAPFAVVVQDGIPLQKTYGLSDRVIEEEGLSRLVYRLEPTPWNERVAAVLYSEVATRSIEATNRLHRAIRTGGWASRSARAELGVSLRGAPHLARYMGMRAKSRLGRILTLNRYVSPQVFWMKAMSEQVPNPNSRVTIDYSSDEFGVPLARLDWRLNSQDVESGRRTQQLFGRAQIEAGHIVRSTSESRELPYRLGGGNHHMGTTRMASAASKGVVDGNCRVHGVDNLFIAGSSVFPTGGYANPTLTLIALAFRLADHVVERVDGKATTQVSDVSDG